MKPSLLLALIILYFLPLAFLSAQEAPLNLIIEGPCCQCSGPYGSPCFNLGTQYTSCGALAQSLGLTADSCYSVACNPAYGCSAAPSVSPPFDLQPLKIRLNVPLPGLEEFSQESGVEVSNQTIAKYIGGVYKFFVGIAGVIAVFMIVFGGVMWLFSGGSAERVSKAKEIILGALFGLILVVGSYALLFNVNPALVEFKELPIPEVVWKTMANLGLVSECPQDSYLASITATVNSHPHLQLGGNVSDPRLLSETLDMLVEAADKLTGNDLLVVTSAHRTMAYQQQLYNCSINCTSDCSSCNEASVPSCGSPHISGKAVDVCIIRAGRNSCSYVTTSCNGGCPGDYSQLSDDQIFLQQTMKEVGFSRYKGEWWHFESEQMSVPGEPGQYN